MGRSCGSKTRISQRPIDSPGPSRAAAGVLGLVDRPLILRAIVALGMAAFHVGRHVDGQPDLTT